MKKENIKVGMYVMVKSKKKREELGWGVDDYCFNPNFCGQKVEVVSEVFNAYWGKNNYYNSVYVTYGNLTQTIPIHLLKKLKEDAHEQQ